MVTDEFSQMGILISMGKDQTRMSQFYSTVIASKSIYGNIPAWRIYRNGNTIEPCRQGINSNCDTASDGTARIIIALFTASKNTYMSDVAQKSKYAALAKKLADDMMAYEIDNTCRQTSFGVVCHWLAGGSNVKSSGISAANFAYTGYYPDAIIAMLEAYANTNDTKYYNTAKDLTLNYLQAANFNNMAFSVPPGKSFRWVLDSGGVPKAQCTDTCNPIVWDSFDASRALGMCQANYYAKLMNVQLPNLQRYCDLLSTKYMTSPTSVPLQFYPDGSAMPPQSGYFAQGLEALHLSGTDPASFKSALDSALSHYIPSTRTFDYSPSIGVYTQSFAVRALGMGIGRDLNAFKLASASASTPAVQGISSLKAYCTYGTTNTPATVKSDITSGSCRTVVYSTSTGDVKIFACEKDNGYVEIYLQAAPLGIDFKACLANGCITKDNGFARFQPSAPSIMPPTLDVSTLSITIRPSGTLVTDIMDGQSCRKVQYNTPSGWAEAKVCAKDTTYEMYLLSSPNAASICIGNNCVGQNSGYVSFRN